MSGRRTVPSLSACRASGYVTVAGVGSLETADLLGPWSRPRRGSLQDVDCSSRRERPCTHRQENNGEPKGSTGERSAISELIEAIREPRIDIVLKPIVGMPRIVLSGPVIPELASELRPLPQTSPSVACTKRRDGRPERLSLDPGNDA